MTNLLKKLLNQLGVAFYQIPWVKSYWSKRFQAVQSDAIPWTPLKKPLSQSKIALITTGGVHLKTDPPFNMVDSRGDPSYRRIPATVTPASLTITHNYYNHKDADEDINLVLPLDIVQTYQQEGVVGSLASYFYGFMGHIEAPHVDTLIKKTAPKVAQALKQDGVDIALLVPA